MPFLGVWLKTVINHANGLRSGLQGGKISGEWCVVNAKQIPKTAQRSSKQIAETWAQNRYLTVTSVPPTGKEKRRGQPNADARQSAWKGIRCSRQLDTQQVTSRFFL